MHYLEFEKALADIEGKSEELRAMARQSPQMDVEKEAAALDRKAEALLRDLYKSLTPWQKCQVARHPERPHCKDYVEALFTEYTPLAGDRNFADDHAIMGGLARFNDLPVMVIGHEKGNDTKSRIARNFGMARPEGYRKAIRLMDLAHRFGLPVITLVDTQGRRGARAIRGDRARNAKVPVAGGAAGVGDYRRGGIGRRGGLRHGEPGGDAGTFCIFGDIARGLCIHPVERR
jgi:acetyl-CoA carboxylase carboxyl transferase alpha subunit